MRTITSENFRKFIDTDKAIIYCWHVNCKSCYKVEPILEVLESEFPQIQMGKLNVHAHNTKEITQKLNIKMTPQILVYYNKQFVGRILYQNKGRIEKEFNRLVNNDGDVTKIEVPDALKNFDSS